jgi:hypothetical protein
MSARSTTDVLAAMNAQPSPVSVVVPTTVVRGRGGGTVRFTFDVPREQHRFIKRFVLDAETTSSAATRALWQMVAEDGALAERLHARLAASS